MSRTTRTNALLMSLMLAFVLTLSAGVVVGVVASGRHAVSSLVVQVPATTRPAGPRSGERFPDALGLNTEQREKLKGIWTDPAPGAGQKTNAARRQQLLKDRDQSLLNLLTDEQKQQYQKEMAEYQVKLDDLKKEWERAVQEKVERTKLILDDKQRAKYEEMLKEHGPFPFGDRDHQSHGGPHGHNGPGRGGVPFMEPRAHSYRGGGPTTEEFKDSRDRDTGNPTTRPG